MSSDLQLATCFENNSVLVLDCLPSNESSRERLYNPLRDLQDYAAINKHLKEIRVDTNVRLYQVLSAISNQVGADWKPIIHFECHGSRDTGLEIGDLRDVMDWTTLASLLTRINSACGGHLGVVMGVCHGNSATTPVCVEDPTPFYFLVGSDDRPTNGVLERELPAFYRTLFETHDLSAALQCVPSFDVFHAEQMLATRFASDLRACIGSGRSEWREDLLTKIVAQSGRSLDSTELRSERDRVKAMTSTGAVKDAFEHISQRFLHRSPSFTFDALLNYVRDSLQPTHAQRGL